ncbi:nose resistant to fluoxetine protein 6-like [Tachypleus tridentatus]|uniref:nose resistant to fluoxetine protein 6-like n=1 Tax=Tachypleus tridentatus TaxID=6853 RepID=UPI003FD01097
MTVRVTTNFFIFQTTMFWFWLGGVFVGIITCSDIIKQLNDTELNNEWAATAAEKIPDASAPWILPDYEVLEAWENMREIYKRKVSDVTLTLKPIIDDFLKTINVSEDCYQSVMTVLTSFGKMETWSTKMIDSNGRLPSGLLEGTLTSLGSYDQCLDIISPNTSHYVTTFQGQYCSVLFRPPLPARSPKYLSIAAGVKILSNFSKPGEVFHHLAQNAQFFYFAALRIGICVPSTCTIHDVQKIATKVGGWLKLKGSVQNCEVKSSVQLTARQIVSICILSAILFLVVTGSALDVYRNVLRKKNQAAPEEKQGKMEEFFGCFSLRSNFLKLFSTKSSEQTIKSIHGIRFLTIIWIIMAHTVNEYHYGMMSGVFNLKTQVGYFDNQFLVQASISVDTFFCISGFLTMYYVWFYTGGKAEKLNVWKFILIRYFRLTPPLVLTLCILFILPLLGSGPVWSEVLMPYVEGCYSTWWRNLLYINTLYEPVKCLGQTWYISCDFIYHVLSLTIFLPMLR